MVRRAGRSDLVKHLATGPARLVKVPKVPVRILDADVPHGTRKY